MKNFFNNLNYKLQSFMYGRYGQDELSRCLAWISFILIVLSVMLPFLYFIAFILFIWSVFRCFSKNTYKRQSERNAYLKFTGKIKSAFRIRKRMLKEIKTHKYYKCPNCKTYMRVPKGKGRIKITCPNCKNEITKTT